MIIISEIGVSQQLLRFAAVIKNEFTDYRKGCSKMKKLLSVVLACALCATFSMGAFALDIDEIIGSAEDYYNKAKEAVNGFVGENPIPDAGEFVNGIVDSISGIVDGSGEISDIVELVPGISFDDVNGIIDIIKGSVDSETLSRVVDESVAALESLGLIDGDFDISDIDTDVAPQFMEYIFDGLESLGVDTSGFEEFLSNSELINFFASLYTGGGIVDPEPEIPQTGSSVTAMAALAVLAIAAATTAVVCTKKEEE